MKQQNSSPLRNVRTAKKFFSASLSGIFSDGMAVQSRYGPGDISGTVRNAIVLKQYIETYVRNSTFMRTPSADTVFRRIEEIASEPGSHRRKGSADNNRKRNHSGTDRIEEINDRIIRMAMSMGAFSSPLDVAIDEHDEPYYGKDNRYLIDAPFHKFRGTNKAYRFATLDCIKKGGRFTLSMINKDLLDGIDSASEVDLLLRHALSLGIRINMVLMDRGYLNTAVMKRVESLNITYIIPAKDNAKVLRFKRMDMKYSGKGFSFLVIGDRISSGSECVDANFVHVIYYPRGKRHDFSFYTNVHVDEKNVLYLAEKYRERWGIENGYQEKSDTKEKTHTPNMGVRRFLFFFSVLLYNLWILLNLIRINSGAGWMTLMDFGIAVSRGRWKAMMNDNG